MTQLMVALAILGSSLSAFAQADKVVCSAALIWADSTSGWGIDGEKQDAVLTMTQNDVYNYSGTTKVSFKNGEYALYVNMEMGELTSDTWSSINAVLVKVENGKNKTLSAVSIPNTYYKDGAIAPVQIDLMSSEVVDQIPDIEAAFKNRGAMVKGLSDGTILGTTMQCARE